MKRSLWIAAAVLVCAPFSLKAAGPGDSFLERFKAEEEAVMATAPAVPPSAVPDVVPPVAPHAEGEVKHPGVLDSYDPEMGRRLAAAAEKGKLGVFKGKCYEYVAWHMDAAGILGFYDWVAMGIQPDYSDHAADFAVWAVRNEEKMRGRMKLAILPTPENKDAVPLGSILVYDRGACGFSSKSGHIEVLTAPDRATRVVLLQASRGDGRGQRVILLGLRVPLTHPESPARPTACVLLTCVVLTCPHASSSPSPSASPCSCPPFRRSLSRPRCGQHWRRDSRTGRSVGGVRG